MLRNLAVAIIKPTNCSWDDAGAVLRSVEKACVCASNLTAAHMLRADTGLFEAPFVEQGFIKLPKNDKGKAQVPKPDDDILKSLYMNVTRQFPFVSCRLLNNVMQDVRKRHLASRFLVALGKKQSSTYRTSPIPQDQYTLRREENGDFQVSIALLSRDGQVKRRDKDSDDKDATVVVDMTRIEFLLHTSRLHGWQKKVLAEIADGTRKSQCLKLVWKKRAKKWMVFFPYEIVQIEQKLNPDRTLEVFPPGRGQILKAALFLKKGPRTSSTDVRAIPVEFESARGLVASYERRSRAMSAKYKQDSTSSSVGHGRVRAIQNKTRWQAKYRRSAKTFNQQRAAFVVGMAVRWQCAKISFSSPNKTKDSNINLLPDWAWYEFGQCLKNAAEKVGIECEERDFSEIERWKEFLSRPTSPQQKEKTDAADAA